jgi:hypothetical protein
VRVDRGEDPLAKKQERRDALTFGALASEYLERYASKKRSGDGDRQRLERDVLPQWRNLKATDIKRCDVIELIEAKAEKAPIAANRLLACIRRLFNWAISRDILESTPYPQVKPPTREKRRDRVLSADEIRDAWTVLETGLLDKGAGAEPAEISMSADVRIILRFIDQSHFPRVGHDHFVSQPLQQPARPRRMRPYFQRDAARLPRPEHPPQCLPGCRHSAFRQHFALLVEHAIAARLVSTAANSPQMPSHAPF